MKEIKFRRPFFKADYPYEFSHFGEWGVGLNGHSFVSPAYNNSCTNKDDQMFTGLKDRNGKEIFEGDIVVLNGETFDYGNQKRVQLVNFKAGMFTVGESLWPLSDFQAIDVIGTLYENPELLK